MTEQENIQIPWQSEENLPQIPENEPYGYFLRGKLRPCTKGDLLFHCSRKETNDIEFIWTPKFRKLVHVSQVEWLGDALKLKKRHEAKEGIGLGIAVMVILGLMLYNLTAKDNFGADGDGWYLFAFYTAFIISSAVLVCISILILIRGDSSADEKKENHTQNKNYRLWIDSYRGWAATGITALVIITYLLQLFIGTDASIGKAGLLKGDENPLLSWRLLSGPMLQADVFHIIFNMYFIYLFHEIAKQLSRFTNSLTMIAVLVPSMAVGSVFSFYLTPDKTTVGLAGALAGLVSFHLVIGYRHKKILPISLMNFNIFALALIALLGYVDHEFDNAAHAGGLLCGLLPGLWWVPKAPADFPLKAPFISKVVGIAGIALFASAMLWTWNEFFEIFL